MSVYGRLDCMAIVTVYRTVISCGTYSLEEAFEFCFHSFTEELEQKKHQLEQIYIYNNNNNNDNNLFLIRCKLTFEYVQMRLTTITTYL